MHLQDKIARDQYEEMKQMFTVMFKGDQAKVDIMMNTKLAKFFAGQTKHSYTWVPQRGKNAGIPRTTSYINKIKRDDKTAKILLPMELNKLISMEIISQEENDRIKAMISSPDPENLYVAETIINQLRIKRIKKRIKYVKKSRSCFSKRIMSSMHKRNRFFNFNQ